MSSYEIFTVRVVTINKVQDGIKGNSSVELESIRLKLSMNIKMKVRVRSKLTLFSFCCKHN